MAKFGSDGQKTFKDLARIQKQTGFEMEKILQITNRFDTFEGAAQQAGQLNAALGGKLCERNGSYDGKQIQQKDLI